jgi:hypothetical protein
MTTPKPKQLPLSTDGLRHRLFEEWDLLRAGGSNPQRAQAIAKLACQVINSVKIEIEFYSHINSAPEGSTMPMSKPLALTEHSHA